MVFSTEIRQQLAAFDNIHFDEPLKPYLSLRVGGPADAFIEIETMDSLRRLLFILKEYRIPFYILGKGTNVIFTDAGFRGMVIKLGGEFLQFERIFVDRKVGLVYLRAGAGVLLQKLVRYCVKNELHGLEEGTGIPASVGGATMMNAGVPTWAFGDHLLKIEGINQHNQHQVLTRPDFKFAYRTANLPPAFFITYVTIQVQKGDPITIGKRVEEIMAIRKSRQPLQYPNCGSVFKNPAGDYAGRLIESCGLKGKKIGAAQISEKHANFIINPQGQASAQDVLDLIDLARQTVFDHHHIWLETEVQIVSK